MNKWVDAARIRTLPLTVACIILGNAVAYNQHCFNIFIFILSLVTALLLQIIANFANDLGDAIKGTDDQTRVGPQRTVSLGLISIKEMYCGIAVTITICCIVGLLLLYLAFGNDIYSLGLFVLFGIMSIVAALCYTLGKHAYGYLGLGDIFSFIFFGILGVLGSYYLQNHSNCWPLLILGCAHGFLVVAVLNVNNMRDYHGDKLKNKRTIVVKFGEKFGTIYHCFLLAASFVCYTAYAVSNEKYGAMIFIPGYVILLISLYHILWRNVKKYNIDPELKRTSVGALLVAILFSLGLVF
jgi:1,4-dihydroxy-2-naphthoate octaprenyltransferase